MGDPIYYKNPNLCDNIERMPRVANEWVYVETKIFKSAFYNIDQYGKRTDHIQLSLESLSKQLFIDKIAVVDPGSADATTGCVQHLKYMDTTTTTTTTPNQAPNDSYNTTTIQEINSTNVTENVTDTSNPYSLGLVPIIAVLSQLDMTY